MKKIFVLWSGALVTILLSVPAVAGVIQLSHVAALIAYINNHAVVAVVILIGGYVLIWTVFKQTDQVAGKLGDIASSATSRIQKGLSNYRGNTLKRRTGEAIEGKRTVRGAQFAVGTMRRFQNTEHGGLSMTRRGKARYASIEAQHMNHTADEIIKRDGGRSGGDDDLMQIAMQRGMTAERAEREYAQRIRGGIRRGMDAQVNAGTMTAAEADARADGEAARRAEGAVAGLQTNFGAQIGSDAMRVAAYKSLLNSKTSYQDPDGTNGQRNLENIINDGVQLMNDGLITATDATSFVKQRADRADRSGIGFGSLQNAFETAQTRIQHGAAAGNAANPLITASEARNLRREALFGTQAGAIVAGRHEAVSALSGVMRDDTEEASANLHNAIVNANAQGLNSEAAERAAAANGNAAIAAAMAANPNADLQTVVAALPADQRAGLQAQQAREAFDRQLASIAGRYDAMGQVSPQNATIMANNVMSQMVYDPNTGQQTTIQQAIETARGAGTGLARPRFVEMRREYANAGVAAQQGAVVVPGQGQGQGGGVSPSDRRLKRNIEPIGTFKDIQLYRFQYLWSDQVYVGVMAQDLFDTHPEAIITHPDGFYRVDYRVLGTRMYTLEEWEEKNRLPQLTR